MIGFALALLAATGLGVKPTTGISWTPGQLSPAPYAWYDATQGITVATGVSQWNDESGNGRNLSQAGTSAQPSRTVGAKGQASVNFSRSSSQILTSSATFTLGSGFEIFIVAAGLSVSTGTNCWWAFTGDVGLCSGVTTTQVTFGSGSPSILNPTTPNYVVDVVCTSGTNCTIALNGGSTTSGSPSGSLPSNVFSLGGFPGFSDYVTLNIREVVVLSGTSLSTANRNLLQQYFGYYYGVL